ncbi:zinc-binding alcohol dehydrogenase family protein [Akkermansiaceae bacterium]|jgi:NADPH2:quinone reductase|nr:zinc-binding alcohol dehydrogenase family protein [Akkermansiaceae bacterium]
MNMKAIQFHKNSSEDGSATDIELPLPKASGHDILVKIEAIAMNPVDYKVRPAEGDPPKTLGFDAAGTVVEVGDKVTLFQKGDQVYHAGDVTRPGTNAEFQLVDERIVAKRPTSLDASTSAALPLTSLTAWESLFARLGINPDTPEENSGKSLLIIGGAGGVGSIAIQLAKLAGLTVVATASRNESADWCRNLGADHIINHHEAMPPQLKNLGLETVDYIANFNDVDRVWEAMADMIAPQGSLVLITGHQNQLNLGGTLKLKSARICWEFMFTRSMYQTDDMIEQHHILTRVAKLVDDGKLIATANDRLSPINAGNILEGHRRLESGSTIGKLVLSGWE